MNNNRQYVMLDTMVYLHYRSPDELCLPEMLGASDVVLLVPRITMQELDVHKNTHPIPKIRDRARKRLVAIQRWIDTGQVVPGVSIRFDALRPTIDFASNGLNPQWNDDQLLAAIIQFRDTNPDDSIALLTQDTGLLLTAKHIGIRTVMVPDDKLLPQEEDLLAKENRELRNELLRLKTARPNLVLRFCGSSDDSEHIEFELETPSATPTFDRDAFLSELRAAVPEMHPAPPPSVDSFASSIDLASAFGERIPASEYKRYSRDREAYFRQMLDYIGRLAAYRTQPERTLLLELELRNIGTVPGEDIDIHIHFPDGFELYSEDGLPQQPPEPSPPEKPQTDLQRRMASITAGLGHMPYLRGLSNIGPPDPFSLRKTNSYDLTDHVSRLKHGCAYALKKLYLVFPSYEAATPFNFDYRIAAANLPEAATGTIHVVVRKK